MPPSVAKMTGATSVGQRASEILRRLDSISARIASGREKQLIPAPLISVEDLSNVVELFKLWVGDIGVSDVAHSALSLEYRLQDAPDVLNEVLSLLHTLSVAVSDVLAIVSGDRENLDICARGAACHDNEDENETDFEDDDVSNSGAATNEAHDVLGIASDCVGRLFRVCGTTAAFNSITMPPAWLEVDEMKEDRSKERQPNGSQPKGDTLGGRELKEHGQKTQGWWRVLDFGRRETKSRPVVIALLGMTGAGKTTFAALASNRNDLRIESGVESCTQALRAIPFRLNGRPIVLIDTPGLDNEMQSDSQILRDMKKWLAKKENADQYPLDCLVFMHPIALNRIGCMEKKYTKLLKRIVNPEAYGRVVIATTMWDEVKVGRSVGWGEMQAAGATVVRLNKTQDSAHNIIRHAIRVSEGFQDGKPLLQLELTRSGGRAKGRG